MRIDMLETGTVLVSLGDEDMREYQLDFAPHANSAVLKKGLLKVIRQVQTRCGMTGRGECYLVEALPGKSGCLLMISVHTAERKRRIYRIKREERAAYAFYNADALLDCMLAGLMPERYELYLLRGSYILLAEKGADTHALSEYGIPVRINPLTFVRIKEYGRCISQPR